MKAILAKTTTDIIKSKIRSPQLFELVLEVYGTPQQFADIITKYDNKEMEIEIK